MCHQTNQLRRCSIPAFLSSLLLLSFFSTSLAFGQASPNLRGISGLLPGSVLFLSIKGDASASSSLWGTDIYTLDSNVAAAAVHAGLLANGQTGTVAVIICDGLSSYSGSTRNGVTSNSWGNFGLSFRFVQVSQGTTVVAQTSPSTQPVTAPPTTQPAQPSQPAQQQPAPYKQNLYVFDDADVLTKLRKPKPGTIVYVQVTGSTSGSVWGSDIYTLDSNLSTAAVHAGVLSNGQRGIVKVTILPGQSSYTASTRNGVTTRNYGSYGMSYSLQAATGATDRVVWMIPDPGAVRDIPGAAPGKTYVVWVTGSKNEYTIWGSDIYTSDSVLSHTAVHAGILQVGESGPVIVHVLPGQPNYTGSSRNGVSSNSYGQYGLSYSLEPAR